MQAYSYDDNNYYNGTKECQLDPLESKNQGKDVWLLPANCTHSEPLKEKEGYKIKWNGSSWEYEAIPVPPPPPEPTEDDLKEQRRSLRDSYLQGTDFTQLSDAPFSDDEKAEYREYREYLRDYPKGDNWWEEDPLSFEDWKK